MTLRALDEDALRGSILRIALPWIRSMPLACVRELTIEIDDAPVDAIVLLGDRRVSPPQLSAETGWWYLQDRLVLELPPLEGGRHTVGVAFQLEVPYLSAGPDGPLRLPIRDRREFAASRTAHRAASRDVA
jgi:hypothetical protein